MGGWKKSTFPSVIIVYDYFCYPRASTGACVDRGIRILLLYSEKMILAGVGMGIYVK